MRSRSRSSSDLACSSRSDNSILEQSEIIFPRDGMNKLSRSIGLSGIDPSGSDASSLEGGTSRSSSSASNSTSFSKETTDPPFCDVTRARSCSSLNFPNSGSNCARCLSIMADSAFRPLCVKLRSWSWISILITHESREGHNI
jgi:hypothetical protein